MTLKRRWTESAAEDLAEAKLHFDARNEPAVARRLAHDALRVADVTMKTLPKTRVVELPSLPPGIKVRKANLKSFRLYQLVYLVKDGVFWIIAVENGRR